MGTEETRGNLITSLHLDFDDMEAHQAHLEAKYRRAEETETRAEEWQTDDAEIVLVGYGIVARILKAVAAEARTEGLKVGVLRPITLYPFPKAHFQRLAKHAKSFVVVELSNGQMVEDVRLAHDRLHGRIGGDESSGGGPRPDRTLPGWLHRMRILRLWSGGMLRLG